MRKFWNEQIILKRKWSEEIPYVEKWNEAKKMNRNETKKLVLCLHVSIRKQSKKDLIMLLFALNQKICLGEPAHPDLNLTVS
jgi:hypothetical protein